MSGGKKVEKILSLIPIALIVLFLHIFTNYVTSTYTKAVIQNNLMWITPIFFSVTLGLIILSFAFSLKHIGKLFNGIDKRIWVILVLIFVLGFYFRTFVAPHTHRLYYDEDIYLNIAQNIKNEGRAILCNYGTTEKCVEGIYNKQPNGYPFLISLLFLLTGVNEVVASYFTSFLSSLTIVFVFFVSYLLTKDNRISLFSSLIFSLIPINIRWAPTTSAGSVFVLFTALTFFGFLAYFKIRKYPLLLFSFSSLAYAIQIRPEGTLLILLVGLMFILFDKKLFTELNNKKFLVVLVLFSVLIAPHLLHLETVKSESWGASGNKLGLNYIHKNLKDNGMFFFENTRFPVVFTILSLLGLYPFKRYWKEKSFLVVWFLTFFGLYLLFYAGSFNYGVDVRFSLNLYIPISILGAMGCLLIYEFLDDRFGNKIISISIPIVIVLLAFSQFVPFVSEVGQKAWDARLAHDFIVERLDNLDKDCWIFTHVPSVVLVNGRNSLQAWYAQNPKIVNKLFSESNCVMFYEEYWCNAEPWKSGPCKYFHDNFELIPYDSVSKNGKTFTLYYMKRK
ncbi:MAG: glycosyltransferase family 39 protein [Candidatus Aenigmarchaeota archaeon]|nr:glycosyltransferase family 39 protein [Candidatus Aenigmarchaeota archaeon]